MSLYNEFEKTCIENIDLQEQVQILEKEYQSLDERYRHIESGYIHTSFENLVLKRKTAENENNQKFVQITNIDWDNDVTTLHFSDGVSVSVTRQKGEKYDRQSAVAYAIAKRVLGDVSVADVVEKFDESHDLDEKYMKIYKALKSKSSRNRIKAQKEWEKIPEKKRASIKAKIAKK